VVETQRFDVAVRRDQQEAGEFTGSDPNWADFLPVFHTVKGVEPAWERRSLVQ
jgi:hypothetical protein